MKPLTVEERAAYIQKVAPDIEKVKADKKKLGQTAKVLKDPEKPLKSGKPRRTGNRLGLVLDTTDEYGVPPNIWGELHHNMTRAQLERGLHHFVDRIHRWQAGEGDLVFWKKDGIVCYGILTSSNQIIYTGANDEIIEEPIDLKKVALQGIYEIKWPSGEHS